MACMIRMVVTDLDGTLLNDNRMVSNTDLQTLVRLGDMGITRVIATGRSPYSASGVIPADFPIDYFVFSSGAGSIRWGDKQIVNVRHMTAIEVQHVVDELIEHDVDFMIHDPIPNNHSFHYHATGNPNPDFERRIAIYSKFCEPYIPGINFPSGATQILAILPNNPDQFNYLGAKFPNLKVIRATSPLDGESIWMEIFPANVSKASGIEWLCDNVTGCSPLEVIALGNDFNDLDMLGFTPNSFVVSNAPEELKKRYSVVPSNNDSGFSAMVSLFPELCSDP